MSLLDEISEVLEWTRDVASVVFVWLLGFFRFNIESMTKFR